MPVLFYITQQFLTGNLWSKMQELDSIFNQNHFSVEILI